MSGWFDDQIKARIKSDEDSFTGAFNDISEAVTGRRIFDEIKDNEMRKLLDGLTLMEKFQAKVKSVKERHSKNVLKQFSEHKEL